MALGQSASRGCGEIREKGANCPETVGVGGPCSLGLPAAHFRVLVCFWLPLWSPAADTCRGGTLRPLASSGTGRAPWASGLGLLPQELPQAEIVGCLPLLSWSFPRFPFHCQPPGSQERPDAPSPWNPLEGQLHAFCLGAPGLVLDALQVALCSAQHVPHLLPLQSFFSSTPGRQYLWAEE